MAAVALIQAASSDLTVARMPTLRADKALGPAPLKYSITALRFAAIVCQEPRQTEPSLELNLIFRHDGLLVLRQVQYAPPTGSIAEP